jgi:two-component system NtrC family sensor kinase
MSDKHSADVHNMEPQARDITEDKPSQDASALLSAIVDSSDDAIISKDLNTIITSWNKGAERLFGYTAVEAIGRPITMIIPPDRLDEEPKIIERLKRGERVDHFETIRMRKDGSRVDISLTITERKHLERQRQEFNQQLEKLVSERTAELRQANHALFEDMKERERLEEQLGQSQKLESLGVLAAGVAHDLNNMLNIIQGYTAVLNPKTPGEEIEESVEAILETTSRGVALVKQLLL